MKKIYYFAAAVLMMTTACNKNTAPAVDAIPFDGDETPVAISFASNVYTNATKAPVDAWEEQTLYVFGYARTTFSDAVPSDLTEAYIDAVEATAPAQGTSGSIDVLDEDGLPFFYSYANNTYSAYDFYACYFADAAEKEDIVKNETSIVVPFVINGSQDLMIAAADRSSDIEGTSITNVNYAYSAYSARNGVTPTLKFQHCLTRFDVAVQNCSTGSTVVNLDEFTVSSIAEGDLVVADIAQGVTGVVPAEVTSVDLPVEMEEGGVELVPGAVATSLGSVMVIPADEHVLRLTFKQLVDDTTEPPTYKERLTTSHIIRPSDVTPVDPSVPVTAFEIGKKYNVLVKVYGLEKIEINVELVPWVDGGSVVVDPDDNPFNE